MSGFKSSGLTVRIWKFSFSISGLKMSGLKSEGAIGSN